MLGNWLRSAAITALIVSASLVAVPAVHAQSEQQNLVNAAGTTLSNL